MKNKLYILLTIAFVTLIFMLGSWGLTDSSEARYAQIGKEMAISGDYINPTLLGIKHLHKPPVTYYLTALGYKIFGVNEFGARFFMQLALVLQILLVFKITLILYKNEKIAFAASLIYFSLPITVIAVRTLTTDAYLTTFILASILFWLQYKKQKKPYLLYLFYIFLGLIFETKGPVGFIIPVTFIISHKIVTKDKIEISIHQFFGFILFLLVSAAWYLAVINKNTGLFDYFFNNQLVERVSENKFKRGKPFWYYIVFMPLLGLPWLFFLIFYFKKNLKTIVTKKTSNFVLLITFTVLFLILSISTSKLILYVLPLYFIIAIFSANYISECSEKAIKNISKLFIVLTTIITLALVVISLIKIDNIEVNTIISILIFIVFTTSTVVINKKISNLNFLKTGYLSVVFILSILFSSIHIFSKNELKINSVKPIATFINNQSKTENEVLVYNYLLPSLSFYLNKNITTINHGRYTTRREVQFETNELWKENLINYFDENDRARVLNFSSNKTIYLIKRKKDKLPDTLATLKNTLKHQKDFGKFEMFY
jgi:4-amino-4-deoxy-L-arabinose transferase-like glycosyltransferase